MTDEYKNVMKRLKRSKHDAVRRHDPRDGLLALVVTLVFICSIFTFAYALEEGMRWLCSLIFG